MPSLKWTDADEIGYQLSQKFPRTDPLSVRFTDLRQWVTELDEFDDKSPSSESMLEDIQISWLEYLNENN